jgi:hypothetical protein
MMAKIPAAEHIAGKAEGMDSIIDEIPDEPESFRDLHAQKTELEFNTAANLMQVDTTIEDRSKVKRKSTKRTGSGSFSSSKSSKVAPIPTIDMFGVVESQSSNSKLLSPGNSPREVWGDVETLETARYGDAPPDLYAALKTHDNETD